MMKRLFILLMFLILPVQAGSYEDAISTNKNVFLYLYTPDCRTCKSFEQIYKSLQKDKMGFEYVKVDANTPYGTRLMTKFRGRYVPYIILTNSKTKKSVNVNHSCVMDEVCLIRVMKSFNG